jgi:hypothetical protein
MVAASKHAFSFGAAGFSALAFLAIQNSDTCNENAATDNQPSLYATDVPKPDFNLPLSVCEMDTDAYPLNPGWPWSPLAEGGAFDIDVDNDVNVLDDARRLIEDLPDMVNEETDNMIDVSYDSLVNSFTNPEDHHERFQNGFGVDMVREGGYFHPVVHTARRNDDFHASNMWHPSVWVSSFFVCREKILEVSQQPQPQPHNRTEQLAPDCGYLIHFSTIPYK